MILEKILENIKKDYPVKQIQIGLRWTAVVSKNCGLASTMPRECTGEEEAMDSGFLTKMGAKELALWVLSEKIEKASVGMAAINSLIDIDKSKCKEMNADNIIKEKGKNKNISVIGHFPFVEELKGVAKNLWVIEKHPKGDDLAETDAENFLPLSDIIAISGTTLINHTFEKLVSLCPKKSIKIVLGPSAPLSPILFDFGIDYISGCEVTDTDIILKFITEGATFRQLKRTGKINLLTMGNNG
ncbi:MAG TPA: hypothetical protein DCX95_05225 [Elusimicrobia bacterium]|nr:hypothetical protein [Elusimicrobiota bacterium]